ncbi:hypothetical protein Xcel_3412 (plasmid) [Xylanimonas cellulosilytica DSM 15894]|uniref:Toxin-antitoxin system n=1 Tax=Xylanimonas cellulosilytica (strain DSM 15894 / JCM 12276 / CECT 5975 / KCTC 9989 / LMG 20990 / NBRC 107835 / XIL07) TaxID=446471 RepID=D1C0U5_XYLCX|nr:hypothetical protein Xcel_3412 [Xylanimonas cellulosilytica DSM 15894]
MARQRTGRRPGPEGKGDRAAITLRVPASHKSRYAAEAEGLGLPLTDYIALRLAEVHDLDTPGYLLARQEQQLPIGA